MSENTDHPPDDAAFLGRFRRSKKGNLVLRGWITDTGAEGRPSAPFQLVVFTSPGGDVPLDRWTWGITVDPPKPGKDDDQKEMEFAEIGYPDADTAALAARDQLAGGGLVISQDAPSLVGVRMRIKSADARRRRDD